MPRRAVVLAITGTPGTGKTAVADELRLAGIPVLDLAALAEDCGAVTGTDRARATRIVDEALLADAFATAATVLADRDPLVVGEGHYAHDMPVDVVAVLRTRPDVLLARLRGRGWPEAKVRENVEAEAMGIIAWEALSAHIPAFEVDTTGLSPARAAAAVRAGARRPRPRPDPGRWPLDDLPWI